MSTEPRPQMPAKIADAIASVMCEIQNIAKSAHNNQGNYDFASIDDFMEEVRPLLGKHSLVIVTDEEEWDIRSGGVKANGEAKPDLLVAKYSFTLSVGAVTWGHRPQRTAIVFAAMGAQALGAAQSYAEKLFLRSLFKISTGAPDVDGDEGRGDLTGSSTGAIKEAAAALAATLMKGIKDANTLTEAKDAWNDVQRNWQILAEPDQQALIKARDDRRVELKASALSKPAAPETPPPPPDKTASGLLIVDEVVEPLSPNAPEVHLDDKDPFGFDQIDQQQGRLPAPPPGRPGARR